MNDPERLAEQMEDPVGRAALRAMRGDAASDQARQKTLAALGLGSGLAAGSAVHAAHAATKASPWLLLKWGAGGAALVALSLGGSAWLAPADQPAQPAASALAARSPRALAAPAASPLAAASAAPPAAAPSAPPQPAAAPRAAEPRAIAPAAPQGEATPAREPAESPAVAAPVALAPGGVEPGQAPAPALAPASGPTLQAELASLERARQRQSSGDPAGALRALDEHQAAFPQGRLGIEATMLRIEALVASGQTGAARDLGARFLAAHPTNPLVPRVRSLTGLTANPSGSNP